MTRAKVTKWFRGEYQTKTEARQELGVNIIITDDGLSTSMGGTVNDHILADDIIITNDTFGFFASEIEILWQCTNDRTLMYFIASTHACAVEDTYEGKDDTVVTNLHITFYIYKGEYLAVVPDFGSRVNLCSCTYFTCHIFYLSIVIYLFTFHHRLMLDRG